MKATSQNNSIFTQTSLHSLAPGIRARRCFKDNGKVFWNCLEEFPILLEILFIQIVMGEGPNANSVLTL